MAAYKRESHARSLLKGISWRCVATIDTIVVFAIVNFCFTGALALHIGLTAAAIEFPLKYFVYYVHERLWEHIRTGDGLDKSRTLKKSISWRIVATLMTFVLAGSLLKSGFGAVAVVVATAEFFSKFALYYIHERIWLKLPLGRIRNWLIGKKND